MTCRNDDGTTVNLRDAIADFRARARRAVQKSTLTFVPAVEVFTTPVEKDLDRSVAPCTTRDHDSDKKIPGPGSCSPVAAHGEPESTVTRRRDCDVDDKIPGPDAKESIRQVVDQSCR